jgi:cytochrome c oxidase cbb3-type subunit 3
MSSDNLLDHQYDGIQEYDNPAPGWWTAIFLASCVFAVGYWIYYMHGPGKSDHEEYAAAMAANQEKIDRAAAETPQVTEAQLGAMAKDAAALDKGKEVFMTHCLSCHTADGKGLVGPNLTDDFQIHGTTRLDMWNVVMKGGREGKGMIPWEPVLAPEEITSVVAFVSNMRHTNVAGGKAPEGEKVEPFAD